MGKRSNAVDLLLLLLCGCTSTVSLEGRSRHGEVTSFHIPSAETSPDSSLSKTHSPASGADSKLQGQQKDDPNLLPLFQLCHPQGRHFAGFEGQTPRGLVLDKVYALVVSASDPAHHLPLPGLPTTPCRSFHQISEASTSEKVRSYPQLVRDYKQLGRSKSGMGVFEMLPGDRACKAEEDVAPSVLTRMIRLGEFLSRKYQEVWPWLQERGKDPVVAGSVPEPWSYQSASALLHGLLQEKQFCRTQVKKLQRHQVRGMGAHQPCPALAEVEPFMEEAYRQEKGLFKGRDSDTEGPQALYRSLKVAPTSAAKDVARSLRHRLCNAEGGGDGLCPQGRGCFNLTRSGVGRLWEVTGRHNAYLSSNPVFRAYAAADTAGHVAALLSWFSRPPVATADEVLRVDVVDDFFFLKLLSALGHRLQRPVLPASRLVIEQFRKAAASPSRGAVHFWRVLVDGEVVTDGLLSCAGGAAQGLCGVETLKVHLREQVQSNMLGACRGLRDEL